MKKGWNTEWVMECWSLYYHIYKYLVGSNDLKGALHKWDGVRVIYFWRWIQDNKSI